MKKNAFVYIWENMTNGKKYIGYHVGDLNDGYISSSHSKLFWDDFNNKKMSWNRTIIFTGDSTSCLIEEQKMLKNIDLNDSKYYNNARGAKIIFTDEVRKKLSESSKKRWELMTDDEKKIRNLKISKSKRGVPRKKETISKLKNFYKSDDYVGIILKENYFEISKKIIESNTGKKRTEKFKNEQSIRFSGENNPMFGKKRSDDFKENRRKCFIENNPGKNKSEETKRKISDSKKGIPSKSKGKLRKKIVCPHCSKEGGEGIMYRWHFNNCKDKNNGW